MTSVCKNGGEEVVWLARLFGCNHSRNSFPAFLYIPSSLSATDHLEHDKRLPALAKWLMPTATLPQRRSLVSDSAFFSCNLDTQSAQLTSDCSRAVVQDMQWRKLKQSWNIHQYIAHLSTDSWKNAKHATISQSQGCYNEIPFYYTTNFTPPFSRIV